VYTTQRRPETRADALESHIEEVRQQKKLLEDQIAKAEEQDNFEAVEELKNSVFVLDRDLTSMSKLIARKEEKRKGTKGSNPLSISTAPINISGPPHPYPPESLLTSHNSTGPSTTDASYVIKAVETSKWVMKSAISSFSSYLSWNSPEVVSTSPPKEYKDDKGSNYAEFEVMQINWYWRQQKRILRFSKDRFLRINPYSKELRAMHYYRTIQEIVITGKTFMTITFNDSSAPEYYQSIDLDKIVGVLLDKALPTVIPVRHVQE